MNKQEYDATCDRIELLMDAKPGTPAAQKLLHLVQQVEKYEAAILARIEENGE